MNENNIRDKVINYLLETKLIEECTYFTINKQPVHTENRDDIIQDTYGYFLTGVTDEKLQDVWDKGHLNAFVTRILHNQLYSNTSEYYRKYRRSAILGNEIKDDELNIEDGKDIWIR